MDKITRALVKALVSLFHPRMLFLMIWPVLVALAFWTCLALMFWAQALAWVTVRVSTAPGIEWVLTLWPFSLVAAHFLGSTILVLLFVPSVLVTSVLIIGLFAMPAMVNHVSARDYPDLERRRGGSFAGAVWNSVAALLILALLVVVTLPLWLLPLLWPILPILFFAYLNQRVFRYDALAEHASDAEMRLVIKRNRRPLFILGIVLSLIGHVPLLGLFAPVYAGLQTVFIHIFIAAFRSFIKDRNA